RGAGFVCAAIVLCLMSTSAISAERRNGFRLEEATIADVHRAIFARRLSATQLVNAYLKRIEAYNGTCVKGALDPATGFQLADIVARLRKAGAIILAKSNMGEYASGDSSTFGGTTCNTYDTSRSAGRSSGGSGAAVGANLVMCAIGEETGPAASNPAANNSLV